MTTMLTTGTRSLTRAAIRKGIAARLHNADEPIEHGGDVVAIELLNLGYLTNPTDLQGLSEADMRDILAAARAVSGADRTYRPIYPGFPEQVRDLSTLQLFVDQIVHYWSVAFDPDGEVLDRFAMVDRSVRIRPDLPVADLLVASKPLRVADAAGLFDVAMDLVRRPVALSPDDREFVTAVLAYVAADPKFFDRWLSALRSGLRNRENWQTVIEAVAGMDTESVAAVALQAAEGVDDLLRVMLSLYTAPLRDEDAAEHFRAQRALANSTSYTLRVLSVPKPVRKLLVRRLGELSGGFRADTLFTRQHLWRRVMRYVHPYEFVQTHDERRALDIVHANFEYRTFASQVEAAFEAGQLVPTVDLLVQRPSQLVARIVHLATLDGDLAYLCDAVAEYGARARVTQLISAFNGLAAVVAGRATVQRVTGRTNFVREQRGVVSTEAATQLRMAVVYAIANRMRKLGGDLIPADSVVGTADTSAISTINRDASSTDRAMERSDRLTIGGDQGILRLFVHWFNGPGRVDLDLGAMLLNEDFRQIASVDYASYHGQRGFATYSGDIVDAPQGAAEFIDIDMAAAVRVHPNARYAAMTVNSYTGQRMSSVDHVAGAMLRSDGDRGQHFDPRTVTTAFQSNNDATLICPMVVDLITHEAIWVDTSNGSQAAGHSISSGGTLADAIAAEIGVQRMTYGDMATLAAQAFGLQQDPAVAVDRDLIRTMVAL